MRFLAISLFSTCLLMTSGCGSDEPVAGTTPPDSAKSATTDGDGTATKTSPAPVTKSAPDSKGKMAGMGSMPMAAAASKDINFNDDVQTNAEVPAGLDGLVFVDTNNKRVSLADYLNKKHVVLVFTEGFSGMLCPFCKTQTARLVANYEKFEALDAEILVVYPGERDHVDEFIKAAQGVDKQQVADVPFPIVLDQKMEAVDYFGIRSKLAHPATYVIDKKGKVQLAYVGNDMSPDRPSVKALLRTLQAAQDQE